jgi:O-antigen/teichoic acid export membrane protein
VSPSTYGQYVSTYALASFLVVLPSYGLETWLLTRDHASTSELIQLWSGSIRSRVKLLLVWIAGMFVLGAILPSKTFPPAILGPTVIGLGFDSLVLLSYAALRSLDKHGAVTVLQSLASVALLGIAFGLPFKEDQVHVFAVGRALISAAFALVTVPLVASRRSHGTMATAPAPRVLESARPFMVAEVAGAVYVKADLTILAFFLGSSGASVYGPALSLLQAVFLIPRALYFLIVPDLSQGHTEDHRAFARKGLMQLLAQATAGAFLSVGVLLLAPMAVDTLFGPAYQDSAEILRLLSPIPFLRSLNFGLGAILASGGRQSSRTRVQLVCAAFSVLGNLVAIPTIGVRGAAKVYVLSELMLCAGYSLIAHDWLIEGVVTPGGANS